MQAYQDDSIKKDHDPKPKTTAVQKQAPVGGISHRWAQACESATGYNPQHLGYNMRQTTHSDPYLKSIGASSAIQGNTITIGNASDTAHELGHIKDREEGRVKADTTIAGQAVCTDTRLESRADAFGAKIQSEYNRM
jgi:hypothetical protein